MSVVAGVVCLCLTFGCEGDSKDGGGSGGVFAGTWSGKVCGRNLTMVINQAGKSVSGSYTLSDPTFSESFNGTLDSDVPQAGAVLSGGGDRSFKINFASDKAFSGGYYKGAAKVCDVSAVKN